MPPTRLLAPALALLLWPAVAHASDMTMLAFVVTLPACIGLVLLSWLLGAVLPPVFGGLLALPLIGLVAIHVWLAPNMVHADEQVAFGIQLVISSTALLAIRTLKRRARERDQASAAPLDSDPSGARTVPSPRAGTCKLQGPSPLPSPT